jgi:D-alanyl-D-alanine carboxypeptidase
MATIGRRLVYDFPQYYNIFSRNSTSAGIATVRNTNRRLLDAYPGADGIKTGYTKAAGFNLVSSAQRGNRRVIVALLGGKTSASRNAEVAKLMDLGFSKMPAQARIAAPAPLRVVAVASAPTRASTAALAEDLTEETASRPSRLALTRSLRPLPRSAAQGTVLARSNESIAAAIAEVNAELEAARDTGGVLRPTPRPGNAPERDASAGARAASTFASAPAAPPTRSEVEPIAVASGTGTTGGNDWGVQLGAYRAKGDAERQLLTTALKDVPQLNGGLRRVEAASVQGVTIYRAQFVGLSQASAQAACETLARMNADCLPLAPGI